jgi:hypothetical protein
VPNKKEEHTVLFSFEEFKAEIKTRLPRGTDISAPQEAVLYSVWANVTYESLRTSYDYDSEYLRSVASQLWLTLSSAFKQKVTKTNLLVLLEKEALEKDSALRESQKIYGVPVKTDSFYGRKKELEYLIESVKTHRCIILFGARGVGKTSLISKIFSSLANQDIFNLQVWTFTELQELENDAEQIFRVLERNRTISATKGLINLLRFSKSLIVIDGVDSWLNDSSQIAKDFVKNVVETNHNSCLLLTVVEPFEFGQTLENQGRLIHNFKLNGLSQEESKILFNENGINGSVETIIDSYRGIPALLLYACEMINYMGGDIDSFIENKTLFSTDTSKQRLNQLFLEGDSSLSEKAKSTLYFIFKTCKSSQILLSELTHKTQTELGYSKPSIMSAIRELERKSLISVNHSLNHPLILLHAEVRGYIVEDPMSIFKAYKPSKVL